MYFVYTCQSENESPWDVGHWSSWSYTQYLDNVYKAFWVSNSVVDIFDRRQSLRPVEDFEHQPATMGITTLSDEKYSVQPHT